MSGLPVAEGGLPVADGGLGETAFSRRLLTEARPFEVGLVKEARDLWLERLLLADGVTDFLIAERLLKLDDRRSELGLVGPPEACLSGVRELDVAPMAEVLLGTVAVLGPTAGGPVPEGLRDLGVVWRLVADPTGLTGGFCKPVADLLIPETEAEALVAVSAVPAGRLELPRRLGFFGACSSR